MKVTRISLMVLSLAAAPAWASDLDLSLTNDSVKGQVNFFETNNDIQLGAGYTYHEGSRHITNLDFHAQGRTALGNLPTTAGIGVRGLAWDDDDLDGGAIGLCRPDQFRFRMRDLAVPVEGVGAERPSKRRIIGLLCVRPFRDRIATGRQRVDSGTP